MSFRRYVVALVFCLALSGALFGQATAASPAKPDTSQEALVYERIINKVRFEDDGTGVRDTTAVIRVQSQAAIQELGQLIFGYSSATETITIEYVRVRKPDGRVIETSTKDAQDFAPDVLREAPMYSDYRQRHISVAGLQPGDVLEYHEIVNITPLAPHEFWYEHTFPTLVAMHEARLEIDVPKARMVKLKSPDHKYETQENGDRRIYTWVIQDFVPDRKRDQNEEPDDTDLNPDVQLSTFNDWQAVAHWYAKLQGERVVVDDAIRKKAEELTKGATTPTEKARRLYDYVARNIRYVSLSFGVGRLQPHRPTEVLQNGYGDCKDKHTLLSTLLKAEGIESYPVLINSYRKLDPDMPAPSQFDHVITAVRLGPEFTWLDATAEIAPYGLIVYPLRNRQALLASEGPDAGLHTTPAGSPVKNQLLVKLDGKFTETGAFDTTIDMVAQGDSDLPLRSAFRNIAQTDWQRVLQYFSRGWGLDGDVSDIHLDPLEDTTKPFHLTYHFHKDGYFQIPASGATFEILPVIGRIRVSGGSKKKGSQPLDVGPSGEWTYRAHIQLPANYSVHVPSVITMTRDYGEFTANYNVTKNVLEAERRTVLKVNELPAMRKSDFETFRSVTSNQVQNQLWCTITPVSAGASAGKMEGSPAELHKAGSAALQRNDFNAAVELLKRSVEQDANQKDAWDDLGRAYAGLNQHDDAVRAFRKQLEIDQYHPRANDDLAAELQQQGKSDEAVAAYRKQLEINPSDKLGHKSLGLLFVQLKRDEEARGELEAAASMPPDDPELKIALAQLYGRIGNKEKSEALMKSVVGTSTMAAGADIFSSALGDKIDPTQTIRDARQTLDDIGDQFDSGEYDRVGPSVFSAMNLIALAWARIGWANFLKDEQIEAMQYLTSAWMLSQSGTVANRLSQVLEKEGQKEQARHMLALAIASGGADVPAWREKLLRMSTSSQEADKATAQAAVELLQARTIKLGTIAAANASARFNLIFDNSSRPDRADYVDGEASLRAAASKLQEKNYPVKFPEVSSIKVVRQGTVSCDSAGCSIVLAPGQSLGTPAGAK